MDRVNRLGAASSPYLQQHRDNPVDCRVRTARACRRPRTSTPPSPPAGGFASALDADTDGVEGLTYAWTPEQLAEVTPTGTFEHGASTLQLLRDPVDDRNQVVTTKW